MMKTLLVLVVIAAAGWGFYEWRINADMTATQAQEDSRKTVAEQAPVAAAPTAPDSSDATLSVDMQKLDTEVDGAQSDSASVEASFTDTPIAQTE